MVEEPALCMHQLRSSSDSKRLNQLNDATIWFELDEYFGEFVLFKLPVLTRWDMPVGIS
jgi:hypothetical protein